MITLLKKHKNYSDLIATHFILITWLKNSVSKHSSHVSETCKGLVSLEISAVFIKIFNNFFKMKLFKSLKANLNDQDIPKFGVLYFHN